MKTTLICDHPGCNCQSTSGKKHCNTTCLESKKYPEGLGMLAPCMEREGDQSLVRRGPARVHGPEILSEVHPIPRLKGKVHAMVPCAELSATISPLALDELCVNTLLFLAVDMVQKANSFFRYQFGGHEEKAAAGKAGAR